MSRPESKPLPPPSDPVPEGVDIGTRPASRNQPSESTPHQRKKAAPSRHKPKGDPKKALLRDALAAARKLKCEHRAHYEADPKAFRAVVAKANARVFRLKPGPKPDARIAQAAWERRRGVQWSALYLRYLPYHAAMNEFVRDSAETGFKHKVNAFLRKHPLLHRRSKGVTSDASPAE
jgi:hypothetical protein